MRRVRDWLKFAFLPLALAVLLLPYPAMAQTRPSVGKDTVVIGTSQEADYLNPMFTEMAAAAEITNTLFVDNVQRDHTWKLFPEGAVKIPTLKDGDWIVDAPKKTMSLRWEIKARKWNDGTPVTCGDYVFVHNISRNEQVPVVTRDITNRIANVVCTDGAAGRKLTVNWKELYPFANLYTTQYGALPKHVLEPFYRQNPSTLNESPYGSEPKFLVTDGAYKLAEWQRGSSLTVVANPLYFEGEPKDIKRIVFRVIPDTNALLANLLSGAIDAIGEVGITIDQGLQLEKQAAGRGIKVFYVDGLIWEHIDFNFDNPLLQDVRVRRAIVHGINRDQIVQQLYEGRLPVAHTYLAPKHPGYATDVQKYPYDPATARRLLAEAGFTAGPDGILRDAQGRRMSLEIQTTSGNRAREQIEQVIQQNLRDVGIEITIRNFPSRVFFSEITNKRRFPALAMYAWLLDPTSDCDQLYTSDGIPTEAKGWAGQNYPGYKSAEMDKACKDASREMDAAKRNKILQDSAKIFARDLPAAPLYYRVSVTAVKESLAKVWTPTGLSGIYESYNAHRWRWD